ncbi:hypothetical protein ACFSKW_43840 [Nonomuraea mangrovi]|uniref:Uncharacterized protein n=1 Tax=Nonomuraea mangrovi TaxID=2316207 RepID=A0ABW4TAK8_9ACTN
MIEVSATNRSTFRMASLNTSAGTSVNGAWRHPPPAGRWKMTWSVTA